jgi:hypothetical protein
VTRFAFALLFGALCGCNESSLAPTGGDLSATADLSAIAACSGPPAFITAPKVDGGSFGGLQFCPQSATPCTGQKLDLFGSNFACAGVQVTVEGLPATILTDRPTYCGGVEPEGITISMPNIPALQSRDAGVQFVPARIHVSNPLGAIDSDIELKIFPGSC